MIEFQPVVLTEACRPKVNLDLYIGYAKTKHSGYDCIEINLDADSLFPIFFDLADALCEDFTLGLGNFYSKYELFTCDFSKYQLFKLESLQKWMLKDGYAYFACYNSETKIEIQLTRDKTIVLYNPKPVFFDILKSHGIQEIKGLQFMRDLGAIIYNGSNQYCVEFQKQVSRLNMEKTK